jgi:glycine cleavage system H lipoate-binding protein
VKNVQYGLDGKVYEYSLDLGAIPKTVKETAKQYGWKFKTVT